MDDAHRRAIGLRADEFYGRYANPTVRSFEEVDRRAGRRRGCDGVRVRAWVRSHRPCWRCARPAITSWPPASCMPARWRSCRARVHASGSTSTFVDGTVPGAIAAAVQPGRTMMVLAETPSNPRLEVCDLDELGSIMGPFTVVDSTFATPLGQRPLAHGVDLVLHSATKGIAGHNDATIGVIAGEKELVDTIWGYAVLHGAMASPFDALNALRGIRTLAVRTAHQSATAQRLAEWLEPHPLGGRRLLSRARLASTARSGQTPDAPVRHGAGVRARRRCRCRQHAARSHPTRPQGDLAGRTGDAGVPPDDDDPRQPHSPRSSWTTGVTEGLVRVSVGSRRRRRPDRRLHTGAGLTGISRPIAGVSCSTGSRRWCGRSGP